MLSAIDRDSFFACGGLGDAEDCGQETKLLV